MIGTAPGGRDVDSVLDAAPYGARYWLAFGLLTAMLFVEVFDFVLTSFVLAQVAKEWSLTFGQAGFILLAFGFGSIAGAAGAGWAGDRFGRKRILIPGATTLAISAGACALVPDGGWVLFGVLRFIAGFGFAAAGTNLYPLVGEFTPRRHRTLLTSALGLSSPLALTVTSALAAYLLPHIGWRGVAAFGFATIIVPLLLLVAVPESPRWLALRGRRAEARAAIATLFGTEVACRIDWQADAGRAQLPSGKGASFEVFRHPRSFWLVVLVYTGASAAITGLLLWGPIIIAQLLEISAAEAAGEFLKISLAGFAGRAFFTYLSQRIGRLKVGYIMCYGSAALILLA
ncbi:MAG: MFS transporter, partial [Steroidobacteraceae bacterium]|nr:MFS transporter [Steroidobacteraceae bacterium]